MSRPPLHHRIVAGVMQAIGRVGDAWNRLIYPVEATVSRLGEGLSGAFDSFAEFEAIVVRAVALVFWPFFAIARLLGRLVPAALPSSLSTAFHSVIHFAVECAERLNLDRVLFAAVWLLTPVWWPVATLLGWAYAWLSTRRPRELALAVPAVAMASVFGFVAVEASWQGRDDIVQRYQVAARQAAEDGQSQRAEFLERKLEQLGVDTRRNAYLAAIRQEDEGDLQDAYERMSALAPSDRVGYTAAHAWLAHHLAIDEELVPEMDKKERLTLAEKHLDLLHEQEIRSVGLAQLRAFVYSQSGRNKQAEEALRPFASEQISPAAARLRLLATLRDTEAAKEQARAFLRLLERERRSGPLQGEMYEAWLLAAELTDDAQQLELAITSWLKAEPEEERPRVLLGALRREQTQDLIKDPTASPIRVAELIYEAASLPCPKLWPTVQLARISGSDQPSYRETRVWELILEHDDVPRELLNAVTMRAAQGGVIPIARKGFASLIDRGEADDVVWNNYAWTLLQEPDPQPEAAMEAVSEALSISPNDYRFRETRGQTLIALGRWSEAVEDLEYALNGMPDSEGIHLSLARAYDALSEPGLAEVHRRRADR